MASLPPCSLCRLSEVIRPYFENNKKMILVYSIFAVIIIEWFSMIYQYNVPQTANLVYDRYLFFWYPLLSQLALFVLFFSLYLWKERLHFCFRKSATTFYLALYYLLGVFGVLFCIQANLYYTIISITSIGLATLLFIVSFFKQLD
jgi:hypothetical protein